MGSDRARISFDATRNYRSVVAQQGRVTLEADVNEQNSIANEAARLETLDIIGPTGTPDLTATQQAAGQPVNYQISFDANGPVIASGVTYVGGCRMELDAAVSFATQPDWLDQPAANAIAAGGTSVLALLVTEQEVSAAEDRTLREVALGGPDTAARSRLMQHFVQVPTASQTCDTAFTTLQSSLSSIGMSLDADTLALTNQATLQVLPSTATSTPVDPCAPPAQGGYLGADNQLVRVTIGLNGNLLWGWNNASFLYQASLVNATTLLFAQTPVDAEHTPQLGQVVEILRSTAQLDAANFIAAPAGVVVTLGSSSSVFDPETNYLTLPPGTLPPEYSNDTNPLFVRLWQAQLPFTSGQPVMLDNVSGLTVQLTTPATSGTPLPQLQSQPFWHFAVRPNTPQAVYPQRYLDAPQPPDGPRQWLADLAVVTLSTAAVWQAIADCRKLFKPITVSSDCDCCNMTLDSTANWLPQLMAAINGPAASLSLCFQPGSFAVPSTITFAGKSVKITGAGPGTILTGSTLENVLEFDSCPSVTLTDIAVVAGTANYPQASDAGAFNGLLGAVTMRTCLQVDIERVSLTCAAADIRAASCLAIYNNATTVQTYNTRVLNSQFTVGYYQVGILIVNADRAQIEGNLIFTPVVSLNLQLSDMAQRPQIAARLKKQLLNSLTITDSAPISNAKTRAAVRRKATLATKLNPTAAVNPTGASEVATAPPAATQPTPAAAQVQPKAIVGITVPRLNLGLINRAQVTSTLGTKTIQFVSSNKLGSIWAEAIRSSALTETSTPKVINRTINQIAESVFKAPATAPAALQSYAAAAVTLLTSTSGQGIVIGGTTARDVRILNNTIDGSVQGVHVGLSSGKKTGNRATRIQIIGNTILVRLTAETTQERHGIFVGDADSVIISDNHLDCTPADGLFISAIVLRGSFGQLMLIERNYMSSIFTHGIDVGLPANVKNTNGLLWKASDNAAATANILSNFFRTTDNIP